MTIYEITEEFQQINELLENATDENGELRELTDSENQTIQKWFEKNAQNLEEKADNYGKFITNLKIMAEEAEATRKMYKDELDRLSLRAKAFENRRKSLLSGLQYAMEILGKDKIKTGLFSFGIQNSTMSINTDSAKVADIPEKFLKREITISKSAINAAIKKGDLIVTNSGDVLTQSGEILEGVKAKRNKILVMR